MLKLFLSIIFSFCVWGLGFTLKAERTAEHGGTFEEQRRAELSRNFASLVLCFFLSFFFFLKLFLFPVTLTCHFTEPVPGTSEIAPQTSRMSMGRRCHYLWFAICLHGRNAASAISSFIPSACNAAHQLLQRFLQSLGAPLIVHVPDTASGWSCYSQLWIDFIILSKIST